MEIIYHFRVRGSGAEGVHIAGMVKALRAMGHRVTLVSPTGADPTAPTSAAPASGGTRLLHRLADRLPQGLFECMELAYNLPARRRLERHLRRRDFDFIYERYAFFNMAGIRAARRHNLPLVLEVNEMSGMKRVRPQTFTALAGALERRIMAGADLIITVSPLLARRVMQITGRSANVMVIPNGVERGWLENRPAAAELQRLRSELRLQDRPVIGFVGGLVHWHALDELLDVVHSLLPEHPDLQLLLVGDGPLRPQLEAKAHSLQMDGHLRITGILPHAAVRRHMEVIDIAVIPHANEYRSPIKLFEYMGAGCAVAAPHTEPIDDVITDGQDGRLFAPRDFNALRDILAALLADPAACATLGGQARRTIAAGYLWEQHATGMLNKLRQMRGLGIDG